MEEVERSLCIINTADEPREGNQGLHGVSVSQSNRKSVENDVDSDSRGEPVFAQIKEQQHPPKQNLTDRASQYISFLWILF